MKLTLSLIALVSLSVNAASLPTCTMDALPSGTRERFHREEFEIPNAYLNDSAAQQKLAELRSRRETEISSQRDAFGRTQWTEFSLTREERVDHEPLCVPGAGCGHNVEILKAVDLCMTTPNSANVECKQTCTYEWFYDQPGW